MSKQLVTRADFNGETFKYLTINLDNNEIDSHILEAQLLDLRPFLGYALYQELCASYPDDDKYNDLMLGVDYTYCGDLIRFEGLKPIILYFAYARYILNQDGVSTPFGIVTKTHEFASQMTTKSVQMKIDNARSAANVYMTDAELFLREKRADYPLFKCVNAKRKGGAIISVVDKNAHPNRGSYKSVKE